MAEVKDLSPEELEAFRSWSSPILAAIRRANQTGRVKISVPTSEVMLKRWLDAGKPGYIELEDRPKAWEIREELGEGPFYVDQYPEPPYTLAEGMEWFQTVSTDPTRLEWMARPLEAPPEETDIKYIQEGGSLYEVTYDPETGEETGRTFVSFLPQWLAEPDEEGLAVKWDVIIDEDTGWRVRVGYDEAGEIVSYEPVGGPPTEPTTPQWRPGELELQQQELAAQKAWQKSQTELKREELEASLTGPRDWIKYWMTTQGPQSSQARIVNLRSEAKAHLKAAQALSGNARLAEEMAAEKLFDKASSLAEKASVAPTTPPTPEWLPEHLISPVSRRGRVGEIPSTGEPIEKLAVRTPSPQLLGGMTETGKLGLAGYADWAAQAGKGRGRGGLLGERITTGIRGDLPASRTWLDILGHMEQMLPEDIYGGRYRRWAPASQRA